MSNVDHADPIDLSAATLPAVLRKARAILASVSAGEHPFKFGGRLLTSAQSTTISVPVGHGHRMMFNAKTLKPVSFMTHEQYNNQFRKRAK